MSIARALSIAGSDSGGGAGVQADLKVFTVLGVYGMSVIAAVTAQNTCEVRAVHNVPSEVVSAQIDAVVADIGVDAAKTGMLSTSELVEVVARKLSEHRIHNIVVDPVMVSKTGAPLLEPSAVESVKRLLLPLALVVTPNLREACVLTGMEIDSPEDMREAAYRILEMGPQSVVIKGGHLTPDTYHPGLSVDLFYDGQDFIELAGPRFPTEDTHGTGCTFSAAITAEIARGIELREAVRRAKRFIEGAIEHSLRLGKGHGPTNPWSGARKLERAHGEGDGIVQ